MEEGAADTRDRLARSTLPEAVAQAFAAAAPLPDGWRIEATAAGSRVLAHASGSAQLRPWAEADRAGWLHWLAEWNRDGLKGAWLRLPGGGGLRLVPGAGTHPLWGPSDLLCTEDGPGEGPIREVGKLPALDYDRLEALPPFDRPGALPPGAGGAVLNWLARLMALRGVEETFYRGPYPTPVLFESLCRSFRTETPLAQALALFTRDEAALAFRGASAPNALGWRPDPFDPVCAAPGVSVQVRRVVEAVWIHGRPFRPASEPGSQPAAGARVWREGERPSRHAAGLVLLGRPWRRFLLLEDDGTVAESDVPPAPQSAGDDDTEPLHEAWRAVAFPWCAQQAHPALAPAVMALETCLSLAWAPMTLSLAEGGPDGGCRVNAALAAEFAARLRDGTGPELGMMLISDVLEAVTPLLRRIAQAAMEAEPDAHRQSPADLLARGERGQAAARERLATALPALAAVLMRGQALPGAGMREAALQEKGK